MFRRRGTVDARETPGNVVAHHFAEGEGVEAVAHLAMQDPLAVHANYEDRRVVSAHAAIDTDGHAIGLRGFVAHPYSLHVCTAVA